MMHHARLPSRFWVECFSTATFLINRLPSPNLNMESPFFRLFGKHPDYSTFRVLGCKCFPYLGDYRQDKLSPKSLPCVFIGYRTEHKGYKCLYPPTGRIYISRHVVFDEEVLPFTEPHRLYDDVPIQGELCTFREWVAPSNLNPSHELPSTAPFPSQVAPSSSLNMESGLYENVAPVMAVHGPCDSTLSDNVAPVLDVHGPSNDTSHSLAMDGSQHVDTSPLLDMDGTQNVDTIAQPATEESCDPSLSPGPGTHVASSPSLSDTIPPATEDSISTEISPPTPTHPVTRVSPADLPNIHPMKPRSKHGITQPNPKYFFMLLASLLCCPLNHAPSNLRYAAPAGRLP
jgi:hypothetical protein